MVTPESSDSKFSEHKAGISHTSPKTTSTAESTFATEEKGSLTGNSSPPHYEADKALDTLSVQELNETGGSDGDDVDTAGLLGTTKQGNVPLTAGFNVLRFKDNFLEIVEELRLRRVQDFENTKRIQGLLAKKHEAVQKLDEATDQLKLSTKSCLIQTEEANKKHDEVIQQYKSEQIRSTLLCESREKELKALKDEMRALHLIKHNLEKKVKEQERQLQLQNSSKENHLNKMVQLEDKCSSLSSLADEVKEQIELLESNVKQAADLHNKLEYVNSHWKDEITQLQEKLENCHHELIHYRAVHNHAKFKDEHDSGALSAAKLKNTELELKLQVDLCEHLQGELGSLRREHQEVLRQMKEAHALLEKHVESNNTCNEKEEKLKREVGELQAEVEILSGQLFTTREELKNNRERHQLDINNWEDKNLDIEHRLSALQVDFKALQDSYESLDVSKTNLRTEHEHQIEKMKEKHEREMDASKAEIDSDKSLLEKQVVTLQSALDESELELTKVGAKLVEKEELVLILEKLVLVLERSKAAKVANRKMQNEESTQSERCNIIASSQFSPEVITDTSLSEEPSVASCQNTLETVEQQQHDMLCMSPRQVTSNSDLCNESTDLQPPEAKRPKLENNCILTRSPVEPEATVESPIEAVSECHQEHQCDTESKTPSSSGLPLSGEVPTNGSGEGEAAVIPSHTATKETPNAGDEQESDKEMVSDYLAVVGDKSDFVKFSPEVRLDGEDDETDLVNTQISKQIMKVEKFLKTERLRRSKCKSK